MIPSERAHLHIFAVTDAGISGKDNEDCYAVSAFQSESNPSLISTLAIVADGIGGHRAGEVASELAVETICRFVAASNGVQPEMILREAIINASQAIFRSAESNHEQEGMGSTCACTWIVGNRLYTATVGDSRIYLLRGSTIQQLSKDHTWVQEAIDSGALSPNEASEHPNAHVIRRYLGSRQTVVPDTRIRLFSYETDEDAEKNQGMILLPGDCILICSDGLTDLVSDEEIRTQIQNKKGKNALNDLVALANQRGGHDNITIISMTMPEEPRLAVSPPAPQSKTRSRISCVLIGILLVASIVIIGGLAWYLNELGTNIQATATPALESGSTLPPPATNEVIAPAPVIVTPALATVSDASPAPTETAQPGASPPLFTLTPWPTNTLPATP
ncbi:MAG: protein phosphatase 2C domain-containing protein [Anaerolineales bacterium]|nr:protein phosphatase 2C domain-containing protein [Anaerolineales bacterium]